MNQTASFTWKQMGSSSKTKLARFRKANIVFSHMYNPDLEHTHSVEAERDYFSKWKVTGGG